MKTQKLELPEPPSFQDDQGLAQYGSQLTQGDFSGNLSWLQGLTNNSQSSLQYAQSILQPQFRDTLTQIKNEAAANNQLESSTFTDALARSQSDLNSQYQGIVSQQAVADNNTKLGLFGKGLDILHNNQDSKNQFNLQNYDNLVAQSIQNNQNANKANGWQQALGLLSPIGHDFLQSSGINSVPGYGVADVAKIAAPFLGGFGGGGAGSGTGIASSAGQFASNNPFGLTGNNYGQKYSYLNN